MLAWDQLLATYRGIAVGEALMACGYPAGAPLDDPTALALCVAALTIYLGRN